jgi:hypothetical protein
MTKRQPARERKCGGCGDPTAAPDPPGWKAPGGEGLCLTCRELPHYRAQIDEYVREHGPAFTVSSEPPPARRVVSREQPRPPDDPPSRPATAPPHTPPPARPVATPSRADDGASTREPAKPKRPMLVSLDAVEPQPITWMWEPWIAAGMLACCDGLPGEGKSTMLIDVAARVTTGRAMPDDSPGVGTGVVLYLNFEDPAATVLRPRFDAAGADVSRVRVLDPEAHDLFKLGRGCPLEAMIIEHGATLVVIDPLFTAVPDNVNMHHGQDARRVLSQLAGIAHRTGAAIVVVRHLNKGEGRSALMRGEGSIGISGTARIVILVATDPDDRGCRVLARVKGNLTAPPKSVRFALVGHPDNPEASRVEWRGESRHSADDLTAPADDEHRGALDEAIALVRIELADGPKGAREVMAAARSAGISDRTLRRARKATGVRATKTAGAWVLSLPPAAESPAHAPPGAGAS